MRYHYRLSQSIATLTGMNNLRRDQDRRPPSQCETTSTEALLSRLCRTWWTGAGEAATENSLSLHEHVMDTNSRPGHECHGWNLGPVGCCVATLCNYAGRTRRSGTAPGALCTAAANAPAGGSRTDTLICRWMNVPVAGQPGLECIAMPSKQSERANSEAIRP